MGKPLIYLFLIVRPGEEDALKRLLEELDALKHNTGGSDDSDEPSCH